MGDNKGLNHYAANLPDFLRDTFHCDHNEVLIENENEVSISCFEYNNNDDNKLKII